MLHESQLVPYAVLIYELNYNVPYLIPRKYEVFNLKSQLRTVHRMMYRLQIIYAEKYYGLENHLNYYYLSSHVTLNVHVYLLFHRTR